MESVKIVLPDGSEKTVNKGTTVEEVAFSISPRLGKAAVAGRLGDRLVDLSYRIEKDTPLSIVTIDSDEGLEVYRHTASHVMAQAVKRLYKDAKLAIGPAIADGFYYDFDVEKAFNPDDLQKIEAEMERITKEDLPVERVEISKDEAIKFFEEKGEIYKVELLKELDGSEPISMYRQGEFVDLCRGPHLKSTGELKAFKLLSVAGAYWRGSEKNKMLQRIYGTAFPKKAKLDEYLFRIEEAKKRDHRKLGKELDLFSLQEEGPGFPFFHPKGMVVWNKLLEFWREVHEKAGYKEIKTPIMLNRKLWENSGHWDKYKENMYFTQIDSTDFAIKPMNCPGSILVYKTDIHSYREFPIRLAEIGQVHRHEMSGTLHGLMRVRTFTQDDAHIFMLPSQIRDEIIGVINLIDSFYKVFGFSYHLELSTKPENAIGSDEIWDIAISALKEALEARGLDYKINEGDGAFYGPKIDFHLEDSIGRSWQCGTIQLDFIMPERFDLTYIGEDGERHRPVMIHRVVFGSIERFIGILIEHYAGAFPTWLAPVQVVVIPVTENHHEYASKVEALLKEAGVRAELDDRQEKIGYRIREAQMMKIPYMLIIGDREADSGRVAVRSRSRGDLGSIPAEEFKQKLLDEIRSRSITETV